MDPGPDGWDNRGGLSGQAAVGVSCTWCGSLHPDRFMELVRDGWIVGPTDKSYKAYLGRPYTDEEKAEQRRQWANGATGQAIRDLGARDGKTPEQIEADLDAEYEQNWGGAHVEGATVAKFYFQHLSRAQQDEFIALHNARAVRFGYPGYFYRLPFFCAPRTPEETP